MNLNFKSLSISFITALILFLTDIYSDKETEQFLEGKQHNNTEKAETKHLKKGLCLCEIQFP